ncbi:Clp protease ClpP [Acinetobacter pittii]|uniref:head maturation protease, ClpP-related n=1 Tax=Acinetobacter pittii TaxID=48296 RepID=UPI000CE444ED|nr:head maturation protease, ClpP-related [Acinetobacter pittii]PPC02512.1 peptidase [Acinetobacter pittii]WPP78283.1 Clp protease ClpP [Acinetobacter pittii]
MGKRNQLPKADFKAEKHGFSMPLALDRWNPAIKAAEQSDNTISIMDPIGYDWWTDTGVTAKRISAALSSMNGSDVVVNINSPGGDVFEGLTIYNLLREYEGHVTVRVLGLAASAASFIAMAADEIQIARAGFFMIHNAWTGVWGNRNDMRETADFLEQIDETIADIYSIRTGLTIDELKTQMDKEAWINGKNSVEQGFADSYLDSDAVEESTSNSARDRIAAHKIDLIMAKAGVSRNDRRTLMKDFKGTPSAAKEETTPSASLDLSGLIKDMQDAARKF